MRAGLASALVVVFAVLGAGTAVWSQPAQAAEEPALRAEVVASGLTVPVAMQFAPDGRLFVAEKFGTIKVVRDGTVTTFGRIEVNGEYEQGLLGLVLDPEFSSNGHLYIAYTVPDGLTNRISRITASVTDADTMAPGSERVLLDGIPSPTGIHEVGELQIGLDGMLYIASGDGAIDARTAQQLNSLSGKVLRIGLDGSIPADNPFVGQAGARPEIWAYGLRNPFTSGRQPGTGRIFVNDVGQDDWEEINELQRGANYGWTVCEGRCDPPRAGLVDPVYQYSHHSGTVVGRSIAGGAWYAGAAYGPAFDGDYLFADYVAGWIKRLDPTTGEVSDVATGAQGVVNLKVGPDGLLYYVRLDVTTGSGQIQRLVPASAPTPEAPPASGGGTEVVVHAAGTPALGVYPTAELLIDDQVVATFPDIRGDPAARNFTALRYTAAGPVTPDRVRIAFPNDTYAGGEDRNLHIDRITLDGVVHETEDPAVHSTGTWTPDTGCAPGNKESEVLSCGGSFSYGAPTPPPPAGEAPAVEILTPVTDTSYRAGDTISFSGRATDPEDGTLGAGALTWTVVYHHDTHTHPFRTFTATDGGSFTVPDVGEASADTFYRLNLTATDSAERSVTATRDIRPRTAQITLQTDPAGLELSLDGQPHVAPHATTGVAGFRRTVLAPPTQTVGGVEHEFVAWSDGGAATHEITTADSDTVLTATYRPVGSPAPPPGGTGGTTRVVVHAAGTPALGEYPTAELLVDGIVVASFPDVRGDPAARQFVELVHTASSTLTPDRIRVNYPNDHFGNGEDRNLYVDRISVDGVDHQSEDPAVTSTGTWTPDTGCAPGAKRSELLSCGGYFQYGQPPVSPAPPDPSGGSTLTVHAAGAPAMGIYPDLHVEVGGVVVHTFTGVRGGYAGRDLVELTYAAPERIDLASLRLLFPNDAFVGGEDRNLLVDRIVLDGVTYEMESPTVYSVGSWDAATGCAGGYKASEVLSCGGSFSFTHP